MILATKKYQFTQRYLNNVFQTYMHVLIYFIYTIFVLAAVLQLLNIEDRTY